MGAPPPSPRLTARFCGLPQAAVAVACSLCTIKANKALPPGNFRDTGLYYLLLNRWSQTPRPLVPAAERFERQEPPLQTARWDVLAGPDGQIRAAALDAAVFGLEPYGGGPAGPGEHLKGGWVGLIIISSMPPAPSGRRPHSPRGWPSWSPGGCRCGRRRVCS